MITSFKCSRTAELFKTGKSITFQAVAKVAVRKLDQLQVADDLTDLAVPPGNHLEKLVGNRQGQYSIRVNDKWRICFVWKNGNVEAVKIVDYH